MGGAIRYRAIDRAHETIGKVFGEAISQFEAPLPEVVDAMKKLAELVIDGAIELVQLKTDEEKIKLGKKDGDVWASRSKVLEVEG